MSSPLARTTTTTLRQLPRLASGLRVVPSRAFTLTSLRMAEGDAGSPRSGGASQSDAFTKREQASENKYVADQEKQKLQALRKKIADQESQLAKDREEAEKLTQGGGR